MTMTAAWTRDGAVYLLADTVFTHDVRPPSTPMTSFGETQQGAGKVVEELAPKVIRLTKEVAVAVAGNVLQCERLFELLRRSIGQGASPSVALAEAGIYFEGESETLDAFVAYVEGDNARLARVSTERGLELDPPGISIGGSAPAHLSLEARRRLERMQELTEASEEMHLVAALAHLQAFAVSELMTQFGIGGAFLGLVALPSGEMQWAPPITYVAYAPPVLQGGHFRVPEDLVTLIHLRMIDEAGVVFSSTLPGTMRILNSPWTSARPQQLWRERLQLEFPSGVVPLPDDATHYFTFLERTGNRAVVVRRKARSRFPLWVENCTLRLTNVLMERLSPSRPLEFECNIWDSTGQQE